MRPSFTLGGTHTERTSRLVRQSYSGEYWIPSSFMVTVIWPVAPSPSSKSQTMPVLDGIDALGRDFDVLVLGEEARDVLGDLTGCIP